MIEGTDTDDLAPYDAALLLVRGLSPGDNPEACTLILAAAQVHATLAVAEQLEKLVALERRRAEHEARERRATRR